jgi:hypothetical protein
MLHYTRPKRLSRDKNSSLLGALINYEENEVLSIRPLGPSSQHFIYFVTYKWALKARVLNYTRLKGFPETKNLAYLEDS